jgi:NADPH2:quinone reductase
MELRAFVTAPGGPEAIGFEEFELSPPGPGEVRMRNRAIGINFIDTYHRSGLYPLPMPTGLGLEAAGVVEAVGDGVTQFRAGDRVCVMGTPLGAYSTARNLPASRLIAVPDGVSDDEAAAFVLKGFTAEALIERCARVQPGWDVLVHAAAGGVGLLMVQWLKHIGARVIGVVGSEAKAPLVRAAGADEVLVAEGDAIAASVRELTGGKGVEVSLDGVGQASWEASLGATARRGLIVSFGNASGPVAGVNLGVLAQHGSLFVTRPTVFDYYVDPAEAAAGAARTFGLLAQGVLKVTIGKRYALRDAAQAHIDLEARKTTGSNLLMP